MLYSRLDSMSYSLASVVLFSCALPAVLFVLSKRGKLANIPTAGSGHFLGSLIDGFKFMTCADRIIQDGYEKYRIFKVALPQKWVVVVSDLDLLREICNQPEDVFQSGFLELTGTEHTLGHHVLHDWKLHHRVIRGPMTNSVAANIVGMKDATVTAFDISIPPDHNDWTRVPVYDSIGKAALAVSNTVFFSSGIGFNPEYSHLCTRWMLEFADAVTMLTYVPKPFHGITTYLFNKSFGTLREITAILWPTISGRVQQDAPGRISDSDRENDLADWFLEEAKDIESARTPEAIATRTVLINFGAKHTIALSLYHALFRLAANPRYLFPLRNEVVEVIRSRGWTKEALNDLVRVDSFLRESIRMGAVECLSTHRVALVDFLLSNGTLIPAGTTVASPMVAIHHDPAIYHSPHQFDGFRFVNTSEGISSSKNALTSPNPDLPSLIFGRGRNRCPGRFVAAAHLKVMFAVLLLKYDVQLENDVAHPKELWRFIFSQPDPQAHLRFRKNPAFDESLLTSD